MSFASAYDPAFDVPVVTPYVPPGTCDDPSYCIPWTADMGCCADWDTLDPELQCRALTLAWASLKSLTAGQVGSCPVVMRPCLTGACECCATDWMTPIIVDGVWHNCVCGTPRCSCERLCEIVFPGPVAQVTEVEIDGLPLDPDAYRVDNLSRLVRQDGECWPSCQDMSAPLGEVRTMGITYVPGIKPSQAALWAAGLLACEYAKACQGQKCRLPSNVVSVTRQGVSFQMTDQGGRLFPNNSTGIHEVDAYVHAVNPNNLKVPPMVWTPDVPWAGHRWVTS